jgi:hypothetical protein
MEKFAATEPGGTERLSLIAAVTAAQQDLKSAGYIIVPGSTTIEPAVERDGQWWSTVTIGGEK